MQFNSLHFLIFFPVVVLIYFVIPAKVRYIWLLLASYYFYMSWNPAYALLIAFSTLITYLCSLVIDSLRGDLLKGSPVLRKVMLAIGLCSNLAILFVFKYYNFAAATVDSVVNALGGEPPGSTVDVILPVGISFYTFQALGYMIDVYRGDTPVEKNPFRYALFVSFFPQLVAGPIERSGNLLTQLRNADKLRLPDHERIVRGFSLMVWGYFLKVVVADRAAVIADTVFDSWWRFDSFGLIAGAVFFAVQIYCDFASYSTIAIGAARIMGFELMDNFNTPYFAGSVKDFWRSWHISLSTWFRDYVYIPLGGNRKGRARKYLNLMLTQLLSGLWHGADWTYVVWGGIHGVYQLAGDLTKKPREKLCSRLGVRTGAVSCRLLQTALTFVYVTFAWIFFRAPSIGIALDYIKRIVTRVDLWSLTDGSVYSLGLERQQMNILLVSILALIVVDVIRYRRGKRFEELFENQNVWARPLVLAALVLVIIIFGAYGMNFDPQQFIYFQF